MHAVVAEKLDEIEELCRRYHVKRLELFGSATGDEFDPERSDVDFIVVFDESVTDRYAKCYFGLLEELERLFGRHIDLLSTPVVKNPYLRESIDRTRRVIFAA